jgi:hypothetical protein
MILPGARAASTEPADSDAFHDGDELRGVAALAWSDQQGRRAAAALTGEMDLAGQSAPGAFKSLVMVFTGDDAPGSGDSGGGSRQAVPRNPT